jgi:glycosyltransferase involved in cell wall biosynthesis
MIVVNARFLTQKMTGVQRFSIELSLQLKQIYNDDIRFVCPGNIIQTEYASQLGVEIVGKRTGYLWEQFELPRYLKKNGSPLLISFGNVAPICYRNKISTLHDITFIRYPQTLSKSFLLIYKFLIPLVLKTSKHIFTVSEFSKEEISSYYHIDKSKISVIYNAVAKDFRPVKTEKLKKEIYILAVSSFKANKNFFKIYQAFALAKQQIEGLKFYVIGDLTSDKFQSLQFEIDEMMKDKDIKLLGRISDEELIRYYSNAKAFVFASLYEGFGIPVLEAQACGCPVICANNTSLPEVAGNSALMCNPNDKEDIANAIISILQNLSLSNELKAKGFSNYIRFSWKNEALKIQLLLNNLDF